MKEPNIKLNLSPIQLRTLGHLTARWAFFETEMDFTISALGEIVERKQQMPYTFDKRLARWGNLAKQLYSNKPTALHNTQCLIDAARDIHKVRRSLVHGRILGSKKRGDRKMYVEIHRHLDEWKIEQFTTDINQINKAIFELERLTRELINFNHAYLPALPKSLPCKFPPRDSRS